MVRRELEILCPPLVFAKELFSLIELEGGVETWLLPPEQLKHS